MKTALKIINLSKSYANNFAIDKINFDIKQGEIVALIGANGAGKSTCFKCISGNISADNGEIYLFDKPIHNLPSHKISDMGVGITFQLAQFFQTLSVKENLYLSIICGFKLKSFMSLNIVLQNIKNYKKLQIANEVNQLLENAKMSHLADCESSSLSYGDIKKLEWIMMLAQKPKVLLMDEPAAGIANNEREAIMTWLIKLAKQNNATILFTEHDINLVFNHAHRIIVMAEGKIIADGAPDIIREDKQVQELYLGNFKFS